ncbi:MAG: hypothetical protein ACOCVF_02900 [bacterium]
MKDEQIKCGKCKTILLEDKNATYHHWKYYCDKCEEFKIVRTK